MHCVYSSAYMVHAHVSRCGTWMQFGIIFGVPVSSSRSGAPNQVLDSCKAPIVWAPESPGCCQEVKTKAFTGALALPNSPILPALGSPITPWR